MTGPQHYQEAERILRQVAEYPRQLEEQLHLLDVAQVHAALAVAAATAVTSSGRCPGMGQHRGYQGGSADDPDPPALAGL
jgi:hypothetical protein